LIATQEGTAVPVDLAGFPPSMRLREIRSILKERGIACRVMIEA